MYLRRHNLPRTLLRTALLLAALFSALEVLHVQRELSRETSLAADPRIAYTPGSERLFVTAIFWNNEGILRSSLSAALLDLAARVGAENIYVSIHESGSWDRTKDALRELDDALGRAGVQRTISMSNVTHEEEVSAKPKGDGWVVTPGGKKELRRIPYLAGQRNIALRPLVEMEGRGVRFDKVLFVNDVVFRTEDVTRLLGTNGGRYGAACSLDFKSPPGFYDTFALRDGRGDEHVMATWPYFRARESREAVVGGRPVPVKSCWNGMVAMPAEVFTGKTALRFRGIPDSLAAAHLEGSECCLIHADNPLSATKGVWVNPNVRVGYTKEAYEAVVAGEAALSSWTVAYRLWVNRIRRWTSTPVLKARTVASRVEAWKRENPGQEEPGMFCLINEMQVLRKIGWAHV